MKGQGIFIDNETFDLDIIPVRDASGKITRGLKIGNTTRQNQALILYMHPGELKDVPLVGVGITDITYDEGVLLWEYKIREQIIRDGQTVKEIQFNNINELIIDADYKN